MTPSLTFDRLLGARMVGSAEQHLLEVSGGRLSLKPSSRQLVVGCKVGWRSSI